VEILKRISLKKRLILLVLIFAVPFQLLTGYAILTGVNKVTKLNNEIKGIEHAKRYTNLIFLLQRHRGLLYIYMNGFSDPKVKEELLKLEEEMNGYFEECIEKCEDEEIKRRLESFNKEYRELKLPGVLKLRPDEAFRLHTDLIERFIKLLRSEAIKHGIVTDPNVKVRILADATLLELPNLVEIEGQLRGLGSGYLAKGEITPEERGRIVDLYSSLNSYENLIVWTLKNASLKGVQEELQSTRQSIQRLAAIVKTLFLTGEEGRINPLTYFNEATQTVNRTFLFYDFLSLKLEKFLIRVRNGAVAELTLTVLVSATLSGVALLFIAKIYRLTTASLDELTRVANQVSKGNFKVQAKIVVPDETGEVAKALNFAVNRVNETVRELRRTQNRLKKLLYYDTLTNLPNREKLVEEVKKLRKPVICLIDVTNFRFINEIYGEKCGDEILKELAYRLSSLFPGRVYRLYSDDFALMLEGEEFSEKRLREALGSIEAKPFHCNGLEVSVSLTAGVCIGREGSEKLINHAEVALNEAREQNRKVVILKESELPKQTYRRNLELLKELQSALKENRILLLYQPILNNSTDRVERFEALVRIKTKNGEILRPNEFLPIAVRAKLYHELSRQVITRALADFRELPFGVSINLGYPDITSKETKATITETLSRFPNPHRVTFEILESYSIESYQQVREFIKEVKKLGCSIAVDDFGAGFSNLKHLIELQVDYLKIDGSIISRLLKDKEAQVLCEAIVSLAQELKVKTVAEFVSSEELLRKVKELKVDYSQGNFIGKPMEIEKVKQLFL
jgi:diguanylate cyclase (GGDEF)-like protein